MEVEIKIIQYNDIPNEFITQAQRERISFLDKDGVHYWGAYAGQALVGCTSLVIFKNNRGKIKSNYVLPEWRKRGVFSKLNTTCLNFAKEQGVTNITLNCLPDSATIHQRFGATIYRETKTIKYLVYRLEAQK